ncbi:MAG TPA: hypothetical protein PLR50_02355, partial [Candidatus Rifleibacterium sp.]|nr:hypothetical protein [Candidatus Rifleibacterium sp.]
MQAGGVPIMDDRREKYKQYLRDKIKYLEAEIEAREKTVPETTATPEPDTAASIPAPVQIQAPAPASTIKQKIKAAIAEFDHEAFTPDYKIDEVYRNRIKKAKNRIKSVLTKTGQYSERIRDILSNTRTFQDLKNRMDMIDIEDVAPPVEPTRTKKSDREKPSDLPGIATVAPQTALDRYYEAWSKSTESTLMTKEKMAETMNKAADSAIKTGSFAFRSGNPLTPARHEALKEILAGRGYELGELKEDGPGVLTAEARPIAAATEPELTLEQQLAEAKEQLKQAEYQPIKAGGVPVMDARKEQRKRELREKIQRLEAEIEAVVQPTPALSPEPAPAPAAAPSYGETNTLVSKSRYEELKAKFNSKTKNIASGIDPELMAITAEMAVYHLEAGARKFADFAKAIIADVGESFRPYLKSAYLSAKYFPGAEKYRAEMDSESDIDAAVEPVAEPEPTQTPSVGKAGDMNIPALSDALMPTVESWLQGPMTNAQLKKVIDSLGIDTKDNKYSHKLVQEAIEGAIVRVIRKLGLNSDQVLKMYQNQPALDERTVTSILNQAYSTPAPLSMMLIDAIGFNPTTGSVYEPTAGNGLLLSGIRENEDGTLHDYRLNELEKNRNDQLKSLFPAARITNQDAMTVTPERKVDLVMTNPPFGSLKGVGQEPFKIMTSGEVETEFKFLKLDHAIAAKALQAMKDDGKAVLILGAELDRTDKAKSEITGQNARFMDYLYNQYNITGHFELAGDLYKKQGAAWPVIVITIEGRKSFPRNYVKSPKSVERAVTWDEVKTAIAKIEPGKYLTGEPRLSVPGGKSPQQADDTGRAEVPDSTVGTAKP